MEDYGFSLIGTEEAKAMGLPNGSGLFDELFQMMENEIDQNYRNKKEYDSAHLMTLEEKRISFMNRYFVFKKTRFARFFAPRGSPSVSGHTGQSGCPGPEEPNIGQGRDENVN